MIYLTTEQVMEIHHELMLAERQQSVLIAREKLEAALARAQATVFGEEAYPRLSEKAAALLESIASRTHSWMGTSAWRSRPWTFFSG